MNKLLTDEEVEKIAKNAKVLTYSELADYDNIDQVFGNKNKIILLYINEKNPTSTVGHWTSLHRNKDVIFFMDPYGKEIDEHLDDFSQEHRNMTGQPVNFLTRLLYDYVNEGGKVHYDEMKKQKSSPDIATCGRWTALRLRFYKISEQDWQKMWQDLKSNGYNIDKIAVDITNKLL